MNKSIEQQIMFFNSLKFNVKSFDFGALNNNKMKARSDVPFADIEKYLKWLKFENSGGADIYIRPHRHSSSSVIFLDDVKKSMALNIAKKYSALVVETSEEGGCHVWLQTDQRLNEHERYLVQRHLQPLVMSDKGSISGEHFGRLAGFRNYKRGGCWVNVLCVSNSQVWSVPNEVLTPNHAVAFLSPRGGGGVVHSSNGGESESEKEWGYVCGKLEHGADVALLERELILRAQNRGKRNAAQYAKRTISKALLSRPTRVCDK